MSRSPENWGNFHIRCGSYLGRTGRWTRPSLVRMDETSTMSSSTIGGRWTRPSRKIVHKWVDFMRYCPSIHGRGSPVRLLFSAYCSFFRWTRHMDELWTWIICDTISCPLVHVGCPKGWTSLDIYNWLIITEPRVIFLLATDSVDLYFQGRCHVSLSYWLGRFDYPG